MLIFFTYLQNNNKFGCDFRNSSDGEVSVYSAGDLGLIPGSGRSPYVIIRNNLTQHELKLSNGHKVSMKLSSFHERGKDVLRSSENV